MKSIWITISMAICCQCLLAQGSITRCNNELRQGDILCKVKVDYVDPGERGQNQVWQLGKITKECTDFLQGVASNGDTIAIFENDRILHYIVQGDTLFEKGSQQRRAYRIYDQPRPMMHYPSQYGDSISGNFLGNGKDENLELSIDGWGYSVTDGTGLLTDGEDSITHIFRIHLFDDYTENYAGQAKVRIQRDHYMWYCDGYRYPVMESYHFSLAEDTIVTPYDSVTYLLLPIQQIEDLAEDAVNDSLRSVIAIVDALNRAAENTNGALSSINASISADGTKLNINYSLSSACDITFRACDILGNILGYSHFENREAGEWQECVVLNRKPVGNTILLNIKSGNTCRSLLINL